MAAWFVLADATRGSLVRNYLASGDAACAVTLFGDPWSLRSRLSLCTEAPSVIIGEGFEGPDPVNVAAAVVADGHAADVTLVVARASGSLRSRAKRAGITRVLVEGELAVDAETRPSSVEGAPWDAGTALAASSQEGGLEDPQGKCGWADAAGPSDARGIEAAEPVSGDAARAAVCGGAAAAGVPDSQGSPDERFGASACSVARQGSDDARECVAGPDSNGVAMPVRKEGVPVICFVSGRGGVGKSSVCALAAHVAAGWGMRVAALDLDLAFGNLFALCGLDRPADLTPLAEEGALTAEALAGAGREACPGLGIWGPCASPEYAELVQPLASRLMALLTHTHDLVLVDTSTNWGDAVASAAQESDRLVIVSDERPGAIASLARCGSLAVRLGVARTRIVRLMNGCDPRGRDDAFVAQAAQGLACARELRISDGGDEAVELLASGQAAELARLENPFATSVSYGLAQVLQELGVLPETDATKKVLRKRPGRGRLLRRGREVA